jgi:hypothetical protein
MTEKQWLACQIPGRMLASLPGKASERKLRLFACSCCRRIGHLYRFPSSLAAIEVAKRYADGLETAEALAAAHRSIARIAAGRSYRPGRAEVYAQIAARKATREWSHPATPWPSIMSAQNALFAVETEGKSTVVDAERMAQCELLREILGPLPFRPVTIDTTWLTWKDGIVSRLAQAIYDERTFDRMPFLGDALEEAGCGDPEILAHCRAEAVHVRGCWVVDLLLGRS